MLYLAVVVTILGYVLWYWALGRGGIARVGLVQFLQPLSGIVLAAVLLREAVSLSFLLASALVLLGVWLAMKGKRPIRGLVDALRAVPAYPNLWSSDQ